MNEELLVHVLEALANLLEDTCCLLLGELAFALDLLQAAVGEGLKHQVDILFVVEAAEEGSEERVVQVELNLYLPQDVLLHFPLLYPLLRHLLYHAHKPRALLLRHKHLPERPLPQLLQQLKVLQTHLPLQVERLLRRSCMLSTR